MSAESQFDEELPEELKAVEAVLQRLTPNGDSLDRDRMMYLLGRASATPRQNTLRFVWPISTAALLLISLTLGGMLLSSFYGQRQIGPFDNGPIIPNAIAIKSNSGAGRNADLAVVDLQQPSYLQLRNAVLTGGVDALPSPRCDARISEPIDSIPGMPLKLNDLGG
jgi:hypothetical protein